MSNQQSARSGSFERRRVALFGRHPCEKDPAFRRHIGQITCRGLWFAGLAAFSMTFVFVVYHVVIGGREMGWSYVPGGYATTVVMWDKLVLMLMGVVVMIFSRTCVSENWGRLVAALLAITGCGVILFDDFMHQSVAGSTSYIVLVLLIVAGSIPFKPLQMLLLSVGSASLLPLFLLFFQEHAAEDAATVLRSQTVFIIMAAVILTGITALINRYRIEQFLSRRELEALNRALENRSRELEEEKIVTEEQAHRLEELEAAKSRFYTDISHEFRTALTLILGPAKDALNDVFGPLDDRLRKRLDALKRSAHRLQELTNELLDISRIESGKKELDLEPHDLNRFLHDIAGRFSQHAESLDITFSVHSDAESVPCMFDAGEMEKVVANLLSNAFKFTPKGGRVRLSLETKGALVIRVRDSGMGISPEKLPHVFDRFFSGKRSPNSGAGTGVGLALAKELVELHGGVIRAESEPGFGTTMIVTLPKHEADGMEMNDMPSEVENIVEQWSLLETQEERGDCVERSGHSVLVVDDNEDVRDYVADLLSHRYNVTTTTNGQEALDSLQQHVPDLVVSDVLMPKVDGYALCRAIKQDPRTVHVPVVLLTARATEEAKIEGLEAHADDYIYKPFSAAELLVRVENLIELRKRLTKPSESWLDGGLDPGEIVSMEEAFLHQVTSVIEEHIGDSNFGVEWLADEVALSPRQLQRRIRKMTHLSASGLIRMIRLKRAGVLIERHAGTVSEIAAMVGFRDAAYFSRLFKQTFAVTPTEYAGGEMAG